MFLSPDVTHIHTYICIGEVFGCYLKLDLDKLCVLKFCTTTINVNEKLIVINIVTKRINI